MLAFFAAVVPIAGSLYVAFSMVIEYTRAASHVRAYDRIDRWYQPLRSALTIKELGAVEYDRRVNELNGRRHRLMEANGLDPSIGTIGGFDKQNRPQAPRAADLRRQWVLILTSTAGVILVALQVTADAL
ncbi:hypothetical protein [Microbacterium sp. K36]|uniref:hypothetical protein n=1 Tax=Microbacterium sp. K36 TaxID=2305439 RepID=UPI00109D5485|nr:hypothetical protein [Microbacterium sp. K36]